MQISKINSTMPNTSFKGVWIERGTEFIEDTYYDHGLEQDIGTVRNTTYKEYYPYLDEKQVEINNIVKKARSLKEQQDGLIKNIFETHVCIKDKLPFTEAEGKAFMEKFGVNERDLVKFTEMVKLVTRKLPKHK